MVQLPLLPLERSSVAVGEAVIRAMYATDGVTSIDARVALELKYAAILIETDEFSRRIVSYQGNKNARFHSWLRYKEGFSSALVEIMLDKFGVVPGQCLLDPFAGSGTSLLVAQDRGVDAVGIDILPVSDLVWQAKANYRSYDVAQLNAILDWVRHNAPTDGRSFPHVTITESAFPEAQEHILMGYVAHFEQMAVNPATKLLLRLVLMSVLEDISYTQKDGQYLRWDARSDKVQFREQRQTDVGRRLSKVFHKRKILPVQTAVANALERVIHDIQAVQSKVTPPSQQSLIIGSVLEELPGLTPQRFDAVITSPPYCNRYDYTRTYALELAFLGLGHDDIVRLRQEQLSCTVENRSKLAYLRQVYGRLNRSADFARVVDLVERTPALHEIFAALQFRSARNELNNRGVVPMVTGYFTELSFVISELYRVCKPGAHVAIVNDNVRYGGEIIPVDLLMTEVAASVGFTPVAVYALRQKKGNSSQQMGKYGREALRKSIVIWQKPIV